MKGLRVYIYRHDALRCSANGLSAHHDMATLVGENIAGVFEPSEDAPAVKLIFRSGYPIAVPVENRKEGMNGPMMGGSFIYSSDSRFRDISQQPIALHDRFEEWN